MVDELRPQAETDDAFIGKRVWPESDAPLEMVGRKGRHNIDWLAGYIADLLQLQPSDMLLDLCCGNGIITSRLARRAKAVVAVDFSHVLLNQAKQISSVPNLTYLQGDARQLKLVLDGQLFDKAVNVFSFQYFDEEAGLDVLQGVASVLKPDGVLAIVDVPDSARKLRHQAKAAIRALLPERARAESEGANRRFHSLNGRAKYILRNSAHALGLKPGSSELGQWWSRQGLARLAGECGFSCETRDQPQQNPMSAYRFDAVLRRKP